MNISNENLVGLISELNENRAMDIVRERLANNDDPLNIIEDAQKGMQIVGNYYFEGRYYLSGLIMAGEIFLQIMELVQPLVEKQVNSNVPGKIVLGTIKGDIHDIGKNITNMLLTCSGFTVYDLGVDVSPSVFVEEVTRIKPDIVGISCLLTTVYKHMLTAVNLLQELKVKTGQNFSIIIGGSQIDQEVSSYVGADYWTSDAIHGIALCKDIIKKSF